MNVLCREVDRQVIRVENETGSAYLMNYVIYPGISIAYMDAHIQEFSCYAQPKPGVFAINHCEEGRIECNFKNGEFLYMGKGDMSIGKRSCSEYCHTAYFPISHYHGLSLLIETKKVQTVQDWPFLTRRQSDTVKAVQKELRRNLCRHQTIEELAAAYGMAPTTLNSPKPSKRRRACSPRITGK